MLIISSAYIHLFACLGEIRVHSGTMINLEVIVLVREQGFD